MMDNGQKQREMQLHFFVQLQFTAFCDHRSNNWLSHITKLGYLFLTLFPNASSKTVKVSSKTVESQ